jgi:hypothetical protein
VTKKQTGLVAMLVCATAFSSAGALAYSLSRPLSVPLRAELGQMEERAPNFLVASTPEPGDVVELPPTVIVSHHASRAAVREVVPAAARDISDMRCTGWRPLEQGSVTQGVRLCE